MRNRRLSVYGNTPVVIAKNNRLKLKSTSSDVSMICAKCGNASHCSTNMYLDTVSTATPHKCQCPMCRGRMPRIK